MRIRVSSSIFQELKEETVVSVNTEFTSKRLRFKILTPIVQKQAERVRGILRISDF